MKPILQVFLSLTYLQVIFAQWHSSGTGRTIIYLEDEKPIIIPESRPAGPSFLAHKFYYKKAYKKPPPDHVNHAIRLALCCGNHLRADDGVPDVLQYLTQAPSPNPFRYVGRHEVKPVHEHIEDDVKYDFRTDTHSYD